MSNTLFIGKDKIDNMIRALADCIRRSGWRFEQVVGIERGGLNVSRPLAKLLELPHDSVHISRYTDTGLRDTPIIEGTYDSTLITLIVDDLIDGGATIQLFKDHYGFKTDDAVAVLFWNTDSPSPDFFVEEKPEQWLEFYWESDRSVLHQVYELLPLDLQSRFFTLTTRIWYDHYTNMPQTKIDQKEAYAKYSAKQQVIVDKLLEIASRRLHQKLEQESKS